MKPIFSLSLFIFSATSAITLPNAYISNETSHDLTVIDTATNTVLVPSILLTGMFPYDVAITPDGKKAYVPMVGSDTVSVVDTINNTELYTRAVGMTPLYLAITPNGSKVYVVNENSDDISVINTVTDVVNPTPIAVGPGPYFVIFTADGSNKAYVTNSTGGNTISVIDTVNDSVIGLLMTGSMGATRMSISPDSATVCVSNYSGGTVSLINTSNDAVSPALAVGVGPVTSVFSPDGSKVYVAMQGPPAALVKVDVASNSVEMTYLFTNPADQPFYVAITPDGSKVYVANNNSVDANVINTITNSNTTVAVGATQNFVAITPDGSQAYVALTTTDLAVINTADDSLGTPIPVGTRPVYIAFTNSTPAPTNGSGKQVKNIFLTQTSFTNVITWDAPVNASTVMSYKIFRDASLTDLVAVVPASSPHLYEDKGVSTKGASTYYIVSVDQFGTQSDPIIITVS